MAGLNPCHLLISSVESLQTIPPAKKKGTYPNPLTIPIQNMVTDKPPKKLGYFPLNPGCYLIWILISWFMKFIPILSGKYFIPDIYSKQPGAPFIVAHVVQGGPL